MNRRLFLKGLIVTASGLFLPMELADRENVRRFWALDHTMGRTPIVAKGDMLTMETGWFDSWAACDRLPLIMPVSLNGRAAVL